MKKQIFALSALVMLGSTLFIGCSEDDTTAPSITILGNNPTVSLKDVTYTDAGATANDDKDGDITASIVTTNGVNKNVAGSYVVSYSVADKAGNTAAEDRDVYVVDLNGTYNVVDVVGGSSSNYTDVVTVTGGTNINWAKFANYQNATVNGTISGANVTVPSQTVTAGSPVNVANRTFSGSGTLSFTLSGSTITRKIEINYTEVTNGTTVTGTGTYTK